MTTYQDLVASFRSQPREIHTVPMSANRKPLWFYVYEKGGTIYVESARERTPKSRIKGQRPLTEKEFSTVLELYQKRKSGKSVSREAAQITYNQAYWYGIFAKLGL